ncbi:MAG: transcriptional coactivator hfi1/ADA1 [Candelina submexicana]|nr:MAG: transcriptional coactivator hfi1/ADA1 [Candelina submexicana]
MPDIDPAALSRTDSAPGPSPVTATPSKSIGPSAAAPKQGKTINTAQRIDLEPLYTALKNAVGEHWAVYKEAISLFVLGRLNQTELSLQIDHFITIDPSKEHLHNQLISAIYGNVTRDLPDQGVASWVSANDKPTTISKPVSGDAAEQRLKTEVMQLPPRDRRRLKELPEADPLDMFSNMLHEYHHAKQIKLPDIVPASAGGLNKTNWDLEIRKRYSQPLASETGEFPDAESINNRMIPICYEEGIVAGAHDGTAQFMNVATETFIKEVLSGIFGRTRSNGPNYIMTSTYKRQLEREEESWLRGEVQKNGNSLLPVEQSAASQRPSLGMSDLRLALEMGDMYLGQMPLIVESIMSGYLEGELEGDLGTYQEDGDEDVHMVNGEGGLNGIILRELSNGTGPPVDDSDLVEWEGGDIAAQGELKSLLDDCLTLGQ